jgi:hypothetical protein
MLNGGFPATVTPWGAEAYSRDQALPPAGHNPLMMGAASGR